MEIEVKYVIGERSDLCRYIEDHLTGFPSDAFIGTVMNSKSKKFIEKRNANSLLNQYAATAPFLAFCKEGVVVCALYNESIKDMDDFPDMFFNKIQETIHATVTHDNDDGAYFTEETS